MVTFKEEPEEMSISEMTISVTTEECHTPERKHKRKKSRKKKYPTRDKLKVHRRKSGKRSTPGRSCLKRTSPGKDKYYEDKFFTQTEYKTQYRQSTRKKTALLGPVQIGR